jgi:hypothetical protein
MRQEERLATSMASLKAREAKASEQAKARLEEARIAHKTGDVVTASKLESAATTKRSQAAHVAAQAAVVAEKLKQLKAEVLVQQTSFDGLVVAAAEQEQLRRDALQHSLESAAQDAASAAKVSRQRVQECCDDAQAARSDAEELRTRAADPSSKSSELLKSRAAALLEHAMSREADGAAEEENACGLEHHAHELRKELEQYWTKWQTEPLLPEALRLATGECGDDGLRDDSLGIGSMGKAALFSALEDARASCSSSAEDVHERVVALLQFRATLAEQVEHLPAGKHFNTLSHSQYDKSSDERAESDIRQSSGCGPAAMNVSGAKQCGQELLTERDSALAMLERQGVTARNHAALLASLADQMRGALAAVEAAAACGRKRANLRAAASDLRAELNAVKQHILDATQGRAEVVERARNAIDSGDATLAEECMAEVREQLRWQARLANTEAELTADLEAVEQELPLDALEVRPALHVLLT